MIVRIIIILICVTFFINGCNSLISQFAGTHKLRIFDIEIAATEGIGDADFVSLSGAVLSEDFVFQDSEFPGSPGVIIYPILTQQQLQQKEAGENIVPHFIAWTADFHNPCVEKGDCITAGKQKVEGVVRKIPKDRLPGLEKLEAKGYIISDQVSYINHGQTPISWYWNALIMLIAAAIAFGLEAYFANKKKDKQKT